MILPFHKIGKNDAPKAGGKGASLGEMTQAGIPVPPGFVVLAEAFEVFLDTNSLRSEIKQILEGIDHNSVTSIESASEKIQELILNGKIPSEIKKEIQKYQETLDATFVAVRSSATAEDGAEHAWAGQLDTYLNVAKGDVEKKIQSCWSSLFTPRALFYRSEKGLGELHISVAVVVQSMVDAESAGVAFSVHPVTENHDEIVIEGSWGLGEAVVSGEVTPDSFVISKSRKNKLSEHIAEKKKGIFRNKDGQNEWLEIDIEKRGKPILTKEKIQKLSELIMQIENHYDFPCDIEWAHSKEKIYILQARPITTLKQNKIVKNESRWEKMVARHWYPLSWSGSSHIQKEGLKFGNLHWKVNEYLAIRFGGPHITDFCTKENFIETNLAELLQEINNDIEGALDEIHKTVKKLMLIKPGKTKKDAKNIFNDFKIADGIMLMSFYFGPICQEILKDKIGKKTLEKYQIEFSSPSEPTLWVRESNDLTKIKKDILSLNLSQSEQQKIAKKMAKKYGFIHSDIRATSWDKEDYLEEFSRPIIPHENGKDSFSAKDSYTMWLKQIIGKISYAFDEGKCATIRTNWALRETIKNCGAREEQIMKCSENEFFDWIDTGKLPDTDLDEREKYHLMYTNNNEYEEFFDKEKIRKFLEKENIDEFEKIDESVEVLKGQTAFKGKIKGIVKKTYCEKDANELKQGEILVSTMTQPELMRGMIKSAAFITDEGGLLCHAAIIARELRKPCVIGTKIATKVLEDGDLVEVDANNGVVRVLEKKKNIFTDNWQLGATRNMPLWHDILCLYGWEDNMRDYGVDEKCKCLFAIENATHATMFMLPENQKKYFAATAECCKNGEAVKKLRKKYEKYAKEVQHDLKQLAQKQNEKNWKRFFKSYQRFTAGLWITTGFGRIGTDKLEQELTKSGIKREKIPEHIGLLTYPEEHTPLFLSQRDMLIIGNKIQKNKKTDTKKELQKWLEKHKYIPVNYCEDPWTLVDAQEHLTNILEQDCEIALQKLEISHEKKIQIRGKLGKKYGKNIREIGDALAEATSLNEYRKNIFCRLSYSIRYIFETIMKQIGSSDWRDTYYCTPEEILAIVGGESIDIRNIKDERKKCVFVREGDSIIWGDAEQVQKFFGKIYNTSEEISETLQGFSANTGKITGTVKIVLSTKDFYKVQRGDILVTTMTSVDFVPIMEKAGAFVTNEGGITSHAAIVAREMDKPCIIGTKHATRMLKDGDLVEVNADNGIVKILKQFGAEEAKKDRDITEIYKTQISLSEWLQKIDHHDAENLRRADNEKRERLKLLKTYIELPFDEPIKFDAQDVVNKTAAFESYINIHGHEKCAMRLVPREIHLPKLRMRGHTVKEVVNTWFPEQNIIPEKYYVEFIPHPEKNIWSTIFVVNNNGIFGEIIADGHHMLTQGFYENIKPMNFSYDFTSWEITPHDEEALLYLKSIIPSIIVEDAAKKTMLSKLLGSEFINNHLLGYFETTCTEFGTWFIDYNPVLGKLFDDIKSQQNTSKGIIQGVSVYPGVVRGKARKISDPKNVTLQPEEILVCDMTSPDYIHIMQQATAIVTRRGGILTHAGIIARELKKTTIVGIGDGFDLIKDGDIIQVDSDNRTVKILEKKRQIQWSFTYDRQMSYQRIDLFHHGYCTRLSEFFDVTLENELYRIQDGIVSVFYDEVGHKEAFSKIRGLLTGKNSKEWYQRMYRTITRDYKKFISFLDKGEKKSQKNLGEELQAYMNQNRDISLSTWLLYGYIEEILSDVLKDLLQKKINSNWEEVFDILSRPDEIIPADSWEYDTALACVATSSEKEKKTKEIYTKYRSYGMYDVMFERKTPDAIDKKIKDQSPTAHEVIKEIENKYTLQKKTLKKVQNIDWNETEKNLIKLYRLYANFKDWKNFHRERSSYRIQEVYKNIAQKFHIKTEMLWYMTTEEIGEGIQKNKWLSEVEIEKRKNNSAQIFAGINMKNITDKHELDQLDDEISVKKNILQGNTAYPGKIRGKARIINSPSDLKNIVTGEILISSTTRPDYLPFMRNIAGFITNEGGTLSHAAILAREIKKPCIIGTKVATQAIKTGQTITLDATAGTVTIEKDDYFDDKKLLSEGGRACYLYPNRIFCTRMNISHPLWENHLMVISTSENHKVNWYFAVKNESEFDYTLEKVLKKPNMLQEGEKEINRLVQNAEKTLKKEYKNQEEAWKGYENFIKIYEEIAIVPTFVRQLDRAVVRSLREVIPNEEDFAVATYPTKRTYQRQEEVFLLELRTIMGEKITPEIQKNLHEIYSAYFTSGLGYFEEQVKTMENYEERLLGISKEEAGESLRKIQTEEKEMIRKKKELKKNFPEKADVIDIAGFLVYLKDHYKFQINRVQHFSEGLWRSMANITGYAENFLRDFTPEEIQNLLQNNTVNEETVKERIACHAYIYNEQGEPEIITGKKAQDFIKKYLKTNDEQKEFSGRIACKGHGTGKAKIILGTRDFHKMEQGDILIVMNTSPDFVPIMKKAAAIVAEEGGITGHVSVVSREFGIPSVVGIKQITSIIQDGEIVEVDAEQGIVIRHN